MDPRSTRVMAAASISVARILQTRIAIAWQEAVEVARAAGEQSDARGVHITLQNCLVSRDGSVRLASDGSDRVGEPLSTLQLLRTLLDGQQAPPELRQLVAAADDALLGFPSEQGDEPSPKFDLEWFVRQENPGVEIARLASRALEAESSLVPSPVREIERIRAEVSEVPVPKRRRSLEEWLTPVLRLVPSPRAVIAVGGAVIVVMLGLVAWEWLAPLAPRTAAMVPAASNGPGEAVADSPVALASEAPAPIMVTGTVDAGSGGSSAEAPAPEPAVRRVEPGPAGRASASPGIGRHVPSRIAPPPPVSANEPPAPRPAPSRSASTPARAVPVSPPPRPPAAEGRARANAAPAASAAAPRRAEPPPVSPPPAAEAPSAPAVPPRADAARTATGLVEPTSRREVPAEAARGTTRSTRDRRIYSDADADVEPPEWVRPQLPSEPKPDSDSTDSYVEVLVDERGEVVQVRLHSSDLSLNDRMLVAAAKAWQFRPALRGGQPVRYRLRVPVTR